MCGISGIIDLTGKRDIDRPLLTAMNDRQTHRGPDGSGYHFEPGVGLGHRRLSIIDIGGGAQPMFNEDESVAVTFNGEIYEFAELRDELRSAGHVFRTRCDTEVIVHAWEEWGPDCLDRLSGMFAFAIWDRNRNSVFLARDRFWKEAALLQSAKLRDAHFRVGAQSVTGAPGAQAGDRSKGGQGLHDLWLCSRPELNFSLCKKAASRSLFVRSTRRNLAGAGALLERQFFPISKVRLMNEPLVRN